MSGGFSFPPFFSGGQRSRGPPFRGTPPGPPFKGIPPCPPFRGIPPGVPFSGVPHAPVGNLSHPIPPIQPHAQQQLNGLTVQTTHGLQNSAGDYMRTQENILAAIKEIMQCLKRIDDEKQEKLEVLQKELKIEIESLQKKHRSIQKGVEEETNLKKQQLQKRMIELNELNQEAQKKYFECQEDVINQYKKSIHRISNP